MAGLSLIKKSFYKLLNLFSFQSLSFFNSLDVPPKLIEFLEVNPAYTNYLQEMGYSSRSHAYFSGRVFQDWLQMNKYFKDMQSPAILDIGSGIGGIDVLIARKYPHSKISLVDKKEKAGFNVIEMAQDLVKRNSEAKEIQVYEPGATEIAHKKYDIILSLRGLGYLFPYETYRSTILSSLNKEGLLILDLSVRDMNSETSNVVIDRFGGQSSGSEYEMVMNDIRNTLGKPQIISKNHSYHRIVVTRTIL